MDIATEMRVTASEWLGVVVTDYLDDFIRSGGSAVRFLSGAEELVDNVTTSVAEEAVSRGYHIVRLDPACPLPDGRRPDYHQIEKLFFGVSRSFDWKSLAEQHVRKKMQELGYALPPGSRIGDGLSEFLDLNRLDYDTFVAALQRALRADIVQDRAMALEFRSAVSALAYHLIIPDAHLPTTEEVVLRWLHGERAEPGDRKVLTGYQIYSRIDRTSARNMLISLCHWVPKAGYSGLVIILDFRPYEYKKSSRFQVQQQRTQVILSLEQQRRRTLEKAIQDGLSLDQLRDLIARMPDPESRADEEVRQPELTYSSTAYLHMVHLLRAFLDEVESFKNLLLVVATTDRYYDTDEPRNYRDYDALHTRIANEVRGDRANPEGILCHLRKA